VRSYIILFLTDGGQKPVRRLAILLDLMSSYREDFLEFVNMEKPVGREIAIYRSIEL
jgi:hypothetical protein